MAERTHTQAKNELAEVTVNAVLPIVQNQ